MTAEEPTDTGSASNLLFACTGPVGVPGHESPILEAVQHVTDWANVIQLAQAHRMIPLLQACLDAVPHGTCPEEIRTQLKRLSVANAARNVLLVEELARLLNLLQDSGIQAIPFKGPVFARMLHGDFSLRQVDDLDLLLRTSDIMRAMTILVTHGFTPRLDMTDSQRRMHLRSGWGCSLQSPAKEYFVELDSGIAADCFSFHMEPEWLLDRMEVVTVGDRSFRTLSPENYLLLLSVHGAKHGWSRLVWVADLAALLQKRPLDWSQVLQRAEASGARRMLLLGLALAKNVGGAGLPPEMEASLTQDTMARGLAGEIAGRLRREDGTGGSGQAGVRFHLQVRERWRDRLRYLSAMAIAPTYSDWKSLPLPYWLFPLYYLIRPFRLAGEFILGKRHGASG